MAPVRSAVSALTTLANISKIIGTAIGLMAFIAALFAGFYSLQGKAQAQKEHEAMIDDRHEADVEMMGYLKALAERTEDTREMIQTQAATVGVINAKLEERTGRNR